MFDDGLEVAARKFDKPFSGMESSAVDSDHASVDVYRKSWTQYNIRTFYWELYILLRIFKAGHSALFGSSHTSILQLRFWAVSPSLEDCLHRTERQ